MTEQALAQFLANHNVTPDHESYRSYIFNCPSCGGKKKLYIERSTGKTKCFKSDSERCPTNAAFALHLITGLPYQSVSQELYESLPPLPKDEGEIKVSFQATKKTNNNALEPAAGDDIPMDFVPIYDPDAADGVTYLESRGITRAMMVKYGFMYSPMIRRVIFPVIMDNVLYGWQGRAIDPVDKNFRMYNMPGAWKAKTLMFYQNIKDSDFAILAEGAISALKFEKVGGFVASMGKEISQDQIELLRSSGIKKLYLALDRDAADKINYISEQLKNQLKKTVECYIIDIPKHRGDFGDCTYEECEEAFKNAKPVSPNDIFIYMDPKNKIRTDK